MSGPDPAAAPDPTPPPTPVRGSRLNPKVLGGILGALVLAGAAVAGYFLLQPEPQPQPAVAPVISETPTPSPTATLSPGDQVAVLTAASGYSGSGEAARSVGQGRFVLTVSADLPDPGQGKFYEVYLVRPTPTAQFSAGKLRQSDNRWVLTLDQTRDASAYSDVVVTLEQSDDKQPEVRVLTGSF